MAGRLTLPGSKQVSFPHMEFSAGLNPAIRKGFVYSDCRVDDSRLTIANAVGAREKGATVLTRTRFTAAKRVDGAWEATIAAAGGEARTVRARALVNAAGPWVVDVLDRIVGERITDRARLVKGSHIIVPKVHSQGHAYILQNPDKRVVFVIPYEGSFSLIGTTDVAVSSLAEAAAITPQGPRTSSRPTASLAKPLAGPTSSRATPACGRSTTARPTCRRSRAITSSRSITTTTGRRSCRSSAARSPPIGASPRKPARCSRRSSRR
jgi:glycine/D-amino acid oxidase-like deaminating enzyme